MTPLSTLALLAVYGAISSVYLIYLPDALPVLDDWTFLQFFQEARDGGFGSALLYIRNLLDNSWMATFRTYWASFLPVYALSAVAGFSGWPYGLLAWLAHVGTAALLCRIVSGLTFNPVIGFLTGAVYVVFPPTNHPMFWSMSICYNFLQALAFLAWFQWCWGRLSSGENCRYGWRDVLWLVPVLFSGEQILPAVFVLLPLTVWLWGSDGTRRAAYRFCAINGAVALTLLGAYTFLVNRMPLGRSYESRYAEQGWTPAPAIFRFFASLGLRPDYAEWSPAWRAEPLLLAALALAAVAFFWALRRLGPKPALQPRPAIKLLVWSGAGTLLAYLPISTLISFEWRYLYVPATFAVAGITAVIGLSRGTFRAVLAFLAVGYGVSLTYFEMQQCWIPQSRVSQALIRAVTDAGPFRPEDIVIFTGDHALLGVAPHFITGANWAVNSMLEVSSKAKPIEGARELLASEQGEMVMTWPGSQRSVRREELDQLHVFMYSPEGRFLPRPLLALPVPGERFEIVPLASGKGPVPIPPRQPLTMDELRQLPWFADIYFAGRLKTRS